MELGMCEERLGFGCVHDAIALHVIVQGLDAEDVARKHQALVLVVPNGNCEHAA